MDKLFLEIINLSITSSYVILVVIVIRLLIKRAPKIFSYALWVIPFLRLVLPFSFESIFSLVSINSKTIPENIVFTQNPQIHSGIPVIDSAVNDILPVADVAAGGSINPVQLWISIGSTIWVIGLLLLFIYSIYSTVRFSRKLRSASLIRENIYLTDGIETAFVFGLLRPKIFLPRNLSRKEESFIIRHEETHIKRFDHITKFATSLIVAIHWFNPLVWLAFHLMAMDMELSCDESVINEMGYGIKKAYSNSLLSLSTGRRFIGGSPLAFGENNAKSRIKNILNYKKPKFWIVIVSVILIVLLSLGLLSNRPEKQNEKMNPSDGELSYLIPEIRKDTNLGATLPFIDYETEDQVIFSTYFGIFIYDLKNSKMLRAFIPSDPNLRIGAQGDIVSVVRVDETKDIITIHNVGMEVLEYYYQYDIQTDKLYKYPIEGLPDIDWHEVSGEMDTSDWTAWNLMYTSHLTGKSYYPLRGVISD